MLHLFGWDKKFVLPFRDFIHKHFADGRHHFIIYGDVAKRDVPESPDTYVMPNILKNTIAITKAINKADKIIIHGLFNNHLFYLLALQPWLLKKCYWVMWGGDLYIHNAPIKDWRWKKNELFRRFIIKRIGHFVTYIKGDYELAQKWYGARGEHRHCIMYPSNLYKDFFLLPRQGKAINILVGNSADSTNNHAEVFEKLAVYRRENIKIYCPLSYGCAEEAKCISKLGNELFGDKFTPLLEFMPFENYLDLLGQIDIAVFAHKRQQAMGNTITLLGLGKTVYMRTDVTQWKMFKELGINVFPVQEIVIEPSDKLTSRKNSEKIKEIFSERQLIEQYRKIFG
ncbi:MAG: TDP-N-acetylfucosamine:lipid II N-acetylfucosaminyltransferase [Marinobacter sp.]|uniref:TDP-N-acetylfucosamine:lipid II N-acetylfucosaminyltransferase n=1 Tax=Marinobacter sp. TaxID=50741 RepID=UPI0034A05D72